MGNSLCSERIKLIVSVHSVTESLLCRGGLLWLIHTRWLDKTTTRPIVWASHLYNAPKLPTINSHVWWTHKLVVEHNYCGWVCVCVVKTIWSSDYTLPTTANSAYRCWPPINAAIWVRPRISLAPTRWNSFHRLDAETWSEMYLLQHDSRAIFPEPTHVVAWTLCLAIKRRSSTLWSLLNRYLCQKAQPIFGVAPDSDRALSICGYNDGLFRIDRADRWIIDIDSKLARNGRFAVSGLIEGIGNFV